MYEENERDVCDNCGRSGCACCGSCDTSPCECCNECGEPPNSCIGYCHCGEHLDTYYELCHSCDTCDDCGEFKSDGCDCSQFGISHDTPWERRGIKVDPLHSKGSWELLWPEIDPKIDPVQSAADFYLLESVSSGVANQIPGMMLSPFKFDDEADHAFLKLCGVTTIKERKELIKARNIRVAERRAVDPIFDARWIMNEAQERLENLVEVLDEIFVAYGHMAISGELRHHHAVGGRSLSTSRSSAWCGWRRVLNAVGNQALMDASELFREFDGGGYGGPPWANCAEVLYQRLEGKLGPDGPDGKINKRMFIDRIWTLEHNGGSFLNKINWSILNPKEWHLGMMKTLLNAHAAQPTDYKTLVKVASKDTVELFRQFVDRINEAKEARHLEVINNPGLIVSSLVPICKGCYSDPRYGHWYGCAVISQPYPGFKFGEKLSTSPNSTTWYRVHNEDDLRYVYDHSIITKKWKKSQTDIPPISPYGTWTESVDAKFVVSLHLVVSDRNRGYQEYSAAKEDIGFVELMSSLKWYPKMFGRKHPVKLGEITDLSYSIRIKKDNKPVFNFSNYSYGEEAADNMADPIIVSSFIMKHIKDWAIK